MKDQLMVSIIELLEQKKIVLTLVKKIQNFA